ncbi:MAG: D-alanyl-D-alanine carboxypeptidase [Sulfuriferula sp.]|nr:D-alanyl-D-alanine carboxypeptidase [Sulfuriferula sp.]
MKKLLIAALFLLSNYSYALDLPTAPPPELAAKAWLLMDANSGQVLVAHDADRRIEPASLTKLMAAYLDFAAIKQGRMKLTDVIPVSDRAWKTEGSRMFVEPNKPVTVDELLHGMIIQSGNDATVALAENVGGSEAGFVSMMNKEAQRLGMTHTHFVTATGLPDPQHYTTALDLSLIATAIIRDYPEFHPLYSIKEYRYNNITQPNRNRLLWSDPSVDGMKTGHTENAGYCLIASAHRGERRLLSVVLGANTDALRAAESQRLLNYGFQFFDSAKLYRKDQAVATIKVWKGSESNVKVGFVRDLYLSIPRGRSADLKTTMSTQQPLLAPLRRGQTVGTLTVSLDNKVLATYPLQALETVGVASFIGRAWDGLMLKFK